MHHKFQNIYLTVLIFGFFLSTHLAIASSRLQQKRPQYFKIEKIDIQGNSKTKDYVILREMKIKEGEYACLSDIEDDRKRIQNLGLFTRVEAQLKDGKDGKVLTVIVTERWRIFPFPIFSINERDWGKLSYGAGIVHTNFRGRGEILFGAFWLGYNPGAKFSYYNRWFGGERKLFTAVNVFRSRAKSRSSQYPDLEQDYKGLLWTLGKRFGFYTYFSVALDYRVLKVNALHDKPTLSSSGEDQLPSVEWRLRYDSRDLWEYPHRGLRVEIWVRKTGWSGMDANYLRYGTDVRQYFPLIHGLIFAFRCRLDLSGGRLPYYERMFFGYNERIRGHFQERREGENRLLGSAAVRFPIIRVRYFNWESAHFLKNYSRNLKFGISAGFFVDTGSVWFRREHLHQQKFHSGYGFGLHFHLPYIDLLRLEYGLNENFNGEVILDAGVAF